MIPVNPDEAGTEIRGLRVYESLAVIELAEAAGLKVVMNRCPKIELFRPFWKPRLNQAI